MNRIALKNLLYDYLPNSSKQKEIKKLIFDFIEKNKDCFERSLLKGHITASVWLLSHDLQHVLLMHHKKLNMWVQPGGHCDGNSNVLAVAIKEAQEESGIRGVIPIFKEIFDLDIHKIPARKNEPEHDHYDIRFLLKAETDEKIQQNEESHEIRWFPLRQTLPTHEESLLRLQKKSIEWIGNLSSKKPVSADDVNRR